jgi:hypothetical protein
MLSAFVKASTTPSAGIPVSRWLALESAKLDSCNGLCQTVPSKPINLLAWSASPKAGESIPARSRRPVPARIAAASPGGALSRLAGITARTGLAPTRQSTRTLRDEAAQRRLLPRWAS